MKSVEMIMYFTICALKKISHFLLTYPPHSIRKITVQVLITGEIKMVAMGPLTNLGVALRMDPDFSRRLQSLVIMGGNIQGT